MDMGGLLEKFRLPRRLGDVRSDPDSPEPRSLAAKGQAVSTAPLGSFPLHDPSDPAGSDSHFSAAMTAVTSAFGDPTRREIYLFVRSNPGATSSEVATRFSLHPNVARHHLERLATGGYVEVTMERPEGHGAGRPSKRFRAVANDPTLDFLTRRNDLLVLLLQEALQLLGPAAAEVMAERVGEEYGRTLANQMSPGEGQRSLRTAMHAIADTLTAHGFAAHAEDDGASTSVVADNCPFGSAASQYPVLCAVDRGMVSGLLSGLVGADAEKSVPVVLSSRARGDDQCVASA
jgi:predicted ArsR family transcriptional regulator